MARSMSFLDTDGAWPSDDGWPYADDGLDGYPARTMRELQAELGLPRDDLRHALGDGLAKVRSHLA
jgi:hypothetical protein